MSNFKLPMDYIDVAARIVEFRTKHPEGSLQQGTLDFREVAGSWWVVYTALAYRGPDDQRPGMGTAWEPVPGKTNFTRDSEVQNAETAAWGRAIVAALAADTKKGIASAEEVRNRQTTPVQRRDWKSEAEPLTNVEALQALWRQAVAAGEMNDDLAAFITTKSDAMKKARTDEDPWALPAPAQAGAA